MVTINAVIHDTNITTDCALEAKAITDLLSSVIKVDSIKSDDCTLVSECKEYAKTHGACRFKGVSVSKGECTHDSAGTMVEVGAGS